MWQGQAAGTVPAATNKPYVTGENNTERTKYAKRCLESYKAKSLQRQLKAWSPMLAGEVAFEVARYLNVEMPPSFVLTLCLKCPEISKKIYLQICEEIPF